MRPWRTVLAELRRGEGRPLLLHCAKRQSRRRRADPYLMLDKGMSEDEGGRAGHGGWLRGADLLDWGLDYVRRKTGG
jgi:hypothetical protein